MSYPAPGPAPNGRPPHQYQVGGVNPPQPPPGAYGPPPGQLPPGGYPPGPFPPGPPNGGNGKRRVYLAFGVSLAVTLVLSGVVLAASGAFDADEEPTIEVATDGTSEASEEPSDTDADEATDDASVEAEPNEGAAYALLDDVCEVIRPQVETYITIDDDKTESGQNEFFGGSECYMRAEVDTGDFSSASFTVTQNADQEDPDKAAGDYEFDAGMISGSCTVVEDVEGPWAEAVFFYGSQDEGCAFLGYTHTLLVHDGNLFIEAEIIYGDEESDGTTELAVLTGLAEAIVEASAQ